MKKNRVVVISGGTGYLGKSISNLLTKKGFVVFSLGKKNGDITDEKKLKKIILKIKKQFGNIEVLIHAAGAPLIRKQMLHESFSEFNSQFLVHVLGAFNFFKYFSQIMSDKAVIIGITSKAIEPGRKISSVGSYIPAKYALRGLLRVLSDELQDRFVRVYAVAPAFMPGGLNSDIPKQAMELLTKKISREDITSPDEVASVVLNIISDKAKYKGGKSISVPMGDITDL